MRLKVGALGSTKQTRQKTRNRRRATDIIILDVLFATIIVISVFLGAFASLIFDEGFYQEEHAKNNVYSALPDADAKTHELISFMKEGTGLKSYNRREKQHMDDVKTLIDKGFSFYYFCMSLSLVLGGYYIYTKKRLYHVFIYSGSMIIAVTLISSVLQGHFQYFFIGFHKIFFNNNLWMLNPATDKLIVLLPTQFFVDFVKDVYLRSIIGGLFMLIFGLVVKKRWYNFSR